MPLLPDHASPECLVGRYRFTNHPNCDRGELFNLSSRMHRKSRVEQYMRKCVPLARPKWRNPPVIYTMVDHSQTRRLEEILYESSEAAQDERTATV